MIRRFAVVLVLFVLTTMGVRSAWAGTYPLSDGTKLEGEPISPNALGLVVKQADGTYSVRVGWTNFTQEAIKELAKLPKAKSFVEPFLEVDEPEADKKPALEIKPKAHPRLDRPNPKAGFGTMFSSPIAIVLFLLIYAGNIYAAFEIALFRNQHPGMVCGIAAVAPVLGPVVFLSMPTRVQKSHEELAAESMAEHAPEAQQLSYVHPGSGVTAEEQAAAAAAAAQPKVTTYQRGQTSFNRRFFETKFAGFLRLVPGEEEKDKIIYIKSARGEHTGSRLTRIQANELCLQIQKGEATAEVIIPFAEIYEVQVRPKEA